MIEERSSVDHEDAIQPDGFMRERFYMEISVLLYIYINKEWAKNNAHWLLHSRAASAKFPTRQQAQGSTLGLGLSLGRISKISTASTKFFFFFTFVLIDEMQCGTRFRRMALDDKMIIIFQNQFSHWKPLQITRGFIFLFTKWSPVIALFLRMLSAWSD